MITSKLLETTIYQTIKKSACVIPDDVRTALEVAYEKETEVVSKRSLGATLESLRCSADQSKPACGDTGWPIFFLKIGNQSKIEGGILNLEEIAIRCVERATNEGLLRKTMKHPLTGTDPGNNIGMNVPDFNHKFVHGDNLQITFVAKGGGGELFGGSRYKVIAFGDGIEGIEKFIVDSYFDGAKVGAICPPSIIGIGIGGTFDLCAKLAKEAAVLRVIGSHHPEPIITKMEENLLSAINKLKIGIMGLGGESSALTVNIEYAHTHIGAITVAMNTSCLVTRRATALIYANGQVEELDNPNWFGGR